MTANKLLYKKMSLNELIVLAQKDDYRALEELIKREQKNIFASFCYLTKSGDNVSDLTQDVLLKIAKNIKNLKNPAHYKSWSNQIINNVFYDSLRKSKRMVNTVSLDNEENDDMQAVQIPDKRCRPQDKCITSELDKVIKMAIYQLPEPFRIAIMLRELQGLSYEEIAEATSASVGTVKSRIARARGKLQENLKTYI